ncbi:MAG: hypothetical protein Q8N99_03230 [Nanoarchaeota archaeon]|nr:hypothetical protein [Nanoarchaeota archaeon]
METKKKVFATIIGLIILVLIFYAITSAITKYTGLSIGDKGLSKDEHFKNCIKDKEIELYLNSDDISSSIGSLILKDYLDDIDMFNCLRNNEECLRKGVNNFPTWELQGKRIERDISLGELMDFSGCKVV